MMAKIFTGQEIVGYWADGRYEEVICPTCNKKTNLGHAWIDPYHPSGGEKYVHFECLSDKRMEEVIQEHERHTKTG